MALPARYVENVPNGYGGREVGKLGRGFGKLGRGVGKIFRLGWSAVSQNSVGIGLVVTDTTAENPSFTLALLRTA